MSNEDCLQLALVGCGAHGRYLAERLATIPRAALAGVYDADAEAAGRAAADFGAPACDSPEALLAQASVRGVVIASPQFTHKDLTLQAVGAGKHVFVEKPMALATSDCDAMLSAAREAGVKLAVGQVLRLLPPYRRARELIDEEVLGGPLGVLIARSSGRQPGSIFAEAWRRSPGLSGGLLFEVHVHELDLMRSLCGEPESVYAQGIRVLDDGIAYDDLWFVQVRFRSGAAGVLHASQSCYVPKGYFTIQCPHGTISTNNDAGDLVLARVDGGSRTISPDEYGEQEDGFRYELRSWIEAVLEDTPMVVDGFDGRQAVAMAEAAIQSAASNEVIAVP